jgi:hypothetical protein
LNAGTIAQHIQSALEEGVQLRRETYVTDELYFPVQDFVRIRPDAFLKDIRAILVQECDWAELRIAAAFARRELALARD